MKSVMDKKFEAPHPRHRGEKSIYIFVRETQHFIFGFMCFPSMHARDNGIRRFRKDRVRFVG
jgi:hypothetical protein